MKRVLVTGMSGTGKSTLLSVDDEELIVERLRTRTANSFGRSGAAASVRW